MSGDGGQASVELVAILPLAVTIVLALGQLLAAGQASSLAGHAAQAAATAALQGGDPERAARASAPGIARARLAFDRSGSVMSVRVTPRRVLPGLDRLLTARASADAGNLR